MNGRNADMSLPGVPWRASVLTIFPEMFPGPLGMALSGKALDDERWSLDAINLRDFTRDRHKSVDDTPFGGGAGMVMRPGPLRSTGSALWKKSRRPRWSPAKRLGTCWAASCS